MPEELGQPCLHILGLAFSLHLHIIPHHHCLHHLIRSHNSLQIKASYLVVFVCVSLRNEYEWLVQWYLY